MVHRIAAYIRKYRAQRELDRIVRERRVDFEAELDLRLDGRKYRRAERQERSRKGHRTRQHNAWVSDPLVHSLITAKALPMTVAQKRDARDQIMMRDGVGCCYCGTTLQIRRPDDKNYATIEHVVPVALGGSHALTNLKLCCLKCNSERGKKMSRSRDNVVHLVATKRKEAGQPAKTACLSHEGVTV